MSEPNDEFGGDYATLRAAFNELRLKYGALCEVHGIFDAQADEVSSPLQNHEIQPIEQSALEPPTMLTMHSPTAEKIQLFKHLFHGRDDVYAQRWQVKNGKSGYSPACLNEWVAGICLKPKERCADCSHKDYARLDEIAIDKHLRGKIVVGVYPLLPDDTSRFLAMDFDDENWRKDVGEIVAFCAESGIPCTVEISRSGNGAHVWFFFDGPIPAVTARRFGATIITRVMREHAGLSFASYDRMFPNQDTMPKGGFGNLIALPLQKEARERGYSVFVDAQFEPYSDQWAYLSSVTRISQDRIAELEAIWHESPLGELRQDEDEKPWQVRKATFNAADCPPIIDLVIADQLYVQMEGFSQSARNHMKRMAAFSNPQFYKAQAMRMPVWDKPRIICCARMEGGYLCLPRGTQEALVEFLTSCGSVINIQDERSAGRNIDVSFRGILRDEQIPAFEALCAQEMGVLSATTAFGKTVVAAALIGERKVSTLILVHRKQLMEQWQERLQEFLIINETLPESKSGRGRKKIRSIIGSFGAGKDARSGIIDIAILQSMGDVDAVGEWLSDYGIVIIDECHHVPAVSFEKVMAKVRSKYIYGLSATPNRQDGHHPILFMYVGKTVYKVDAKAQALKRPFEHVMIPRFTGTTFGQEGEPLAIGQYYTQIIADELRNHAIVDDVITCHKEGRNCLILSERTAHVETLVQLLKPEVPNVITLIGGKSAKEATAALNALKEIPSTQPITVCATGKYIGEGFDEPRLDTLFLAMPISWHGTLAQYAGRLHRLHDGKTEVRIYDYFDASAAMLEGMYQKRLKGYASIGYRVRGDEQALNVSCEIIYDQDSFVEPFLSDIASARQKIQIVSPYVSVKRVRWLANVLQDAVTRNVQVTIITRPHTSFQGQAQRTAEEAIYILREMKIEVRCETRIHQKFAIMDGNIVWYGSINLLSFGASQESIMRLRSGSIARALEMS